MNIMYVTSTVSTESPRHFNMPKALNRHLQSFEQESIPYSHNISRRLAQTYRRFHETAFLLPITRQSLILQKTYRHHLGLCDIVCSSCHALHRIQERSYRSRVDNPQFFTCCQRGLIDLPSFPDALEPLKSLLQENTEGIYIYFQS